MSQFQRLQDGTVLPDIELITPDIGGAVGPDAAFNINLTGGNNITTTGTPLANDVTIDLTGTTDHAVQVGNATGSLTSLAAATDGQVLLGDTGADPIFATIPNGANISWTAGAGTLQADLTGTTDHTVQVGNATGSLTSLAALTDGQLVIGSTGLDPATASIGNGANISWTAGAGTLQADLTGTTDHTVQVGNATGSLTSLAAATDGQVLIGDTGADPIFGTIASAGGTIVFTPGAGTLNMETGGAIATTYTAEDATTATPALGNINIVGTATNGISTTAAGSTVTVGMASPYSDGDFTFTGNLAAATRTVTISNTDNTATASNAALNLSVGGTTSTGDPYVNWLVTGGGTFSAGIDNSATDTWKLTTGATPSAGTEAMVVQSTGNVWCPVALNAGPGAGAPSAGKIIRGEGNVAGTLYTSMIYNSNNSNDASSAKFQAAVGGTSSGDPFVEFFISAAPTISMSIGRDNSAADELKITNGGSPSAGTTLWSMTTAGANSLLAGNFDVTRSASAGTVSATIANTENTAVYSAAALNLSVGGTTTTGDPYVNWLVTGGGTFSAGIDNSDSDVWKLTKTANTSAVTTDVMVYYNANNSAGSYLNFFNYQWPTAGDDIILRVTHSDNTNAASHSKIHALTGGASGGDPYFNCQVTGAGEFSMGIDNSDSDNWKLTTGATPSAGTETLIITSTGAATFPVTCSANLPTTDATNAAYDLEANNAYIANRGGGVTFTLPATCVVGRVIKIIGKLGLWILAQNAGQTTYIGLANTTAGVGGSLTATNAGDCIELFCITANTEFRVVSSMGNITVV